MVQMSWNVKGQNTTSRTTEYVPVADVSNRQEFLKVNIEDSAEKMKTIKEQPEGEENNEDGDSDHQAYSEDELNERDDFNSDEDKAIQSRYNKLYKQGNDDDEEDKAYIESDEEDPEEVEPDESAFEEYQHRRENIEFGDGDEESLADEEKSTVD